MRLRQTPFQVCAVVCIAMAASVSAHHSPSQFDIDTISVVEGTVTKVEWTNPHVYLTVSDGANSQWLIETDAVPILVRSGWSRDSFSVGDEVSARVHPSRSGDRHVLLASIRTSDGGVLDSLNRAGRENEAASSTAASFAGVWTAGRSQPLAFIDQWRSHPLTPKGREALANYGSRVGTPAECVPWPTPYFMTTNDWYLNEIERLSDRILMRSEFYNAERVIFMDGRGHPDDGPSTVQGHSVGWWEDDVLVIDTTGFAAHPSPVATDIGIPSGTSKHVVERLRLSDDGSRLVIDIRVEDPEYLAEPLSVQFVWLYAPHLEMIGAPCEPEIARRYLD
jgi:hypothetical protein